MKDAPVLHRVELALFWVVRAMIRLLPHTGARRLGRLLGRLAHLVDRRHRRVARKNVARVFPELPEPERRRLVARAFEHFGLATADSISSYRFDLEEICRRTDLIGWHLFQEAEAARESRGATGTIMTTPHLGLWEMAPVPFGIYGGPLHVVGRPLDNPHLDRRLTAQRERLGNRLIPKRGAVRPMLKALAQGGRVGLLIDQRAKPHEGITVPFFGLPSTTTPALARLSLRTGAPIVTAFCHPLPGGRYRIEVQPALWPDEVMSEGFEGDAAVAELTRRLLAVYEHGIRRHPEQWLWMHDRWRDQDLG